MIIGCDIDGVLADFNDSFIRRVIKVTGKDLFPPRPFDIPTWNYPEYYGYTAADTSAVWADIKSDDLFWEALPAYMDTDEAIGYLEDRCFYNRDDIYYVTARPGVMAKVQTENWLMRHGAIRPTVIISSQKGLVCEALKVDAYIDDKWENVCDVADNDVTKAYLMVRPWNRGLNHEYSAITEVTAVKDFLTL